MSSTAVSFAQSGVGEVSAIASGNTVGAVEGGVGIATKIATALEPIPIVGQIVAIGTTLFNTVLGFIGAAHAAKVRQEAQTLNQALPRFENTVFQIMNALNLGQTSPDAAIAALQQAEAQWNSDVQSIRKWNGSCKPANLSPPPGGPIGDQYCHSEHSGGDCCIYASNWAHCATGGDCNAACAITCGLVQPTVAALTAIINAGGGSFTIPESKSNGQIGDVPELTITYVKPNVITQIDRAIEGVFGIAPSAANTAQDYLLFAAIVGLLIFGIWGVWQFGKRR